MSDSIAEKLEAAGLWRRAAARWLVVMDGVIPMFSVNGSASGVNIASHRLSRSNSMETDSESYLSEKRTLTSCQARAGLFIKRLRSTGKYV